MNCTTLKTLIENEAERVMFTALLHQFFFSQHLVSVWELGPEETNYCNIISGML